MKVPRKDWENLNGHPAKVFWLTGLSGAGKTTLAEGFHHRLYAAGLRSVVLDGDELRQGLCRDLGFSPEDRQENIRRAGELARLFFDQGLVVICAFISPFAQDRQAVRDLFAPGEFQEIYVRCPLEICRQRDPKGLYKKQLPHFTGVSSPYDEPLDPELVLDTQVLSIQESGDRLWEFWKKGEESWGPDL